MCVLMCFFMHLGTDFSHDFLLENIFLGEWETKCRTNRFQTVTFFLIFLQHVSLTLFQALAKYFNH